MPRAKTECNTSLQIAVVQCSKEICRYSANKRSSTSLWFHMRWGGKEMAIEHIFLSIS